MLMLILFLIGALFLTVATFQDLKKGEIDNWIPFFFAFVILGLKLVYSWNFFLVGLVGLIPFVILGIVFFYGKLFEGGDAKLLMAMGSIIPLTESLTFMINFLEILILFVVIIALFRVIFQKKTFKESFKEIRIAPVFLITYLVYFLI